MENIHNLHPEQLDLLIKEKEIDLQMKMSKRDNLLDTINGALPNLYTGDVKKNLKSMQVAKKEYLNLVLECENMQKEILSLRESLRVSISFHGDDSELYQVLEETGANSLIQGNKQAMEKRKKLLMESVAMDKIIETCKDVLMVEKKMAKPTKKKAKEAQKLLELINMSPEQRLKKAKEDRVSTLKKAGVGTAIIGGVASFVFPPALIVTAPLAITALAGYGASKTKVGKKLLTSTKDDVRLLTKTIQEFAYPPQQIGSGYGHKQDIYGDMR